MAKLSHGTNYLEVGVEQTTAVREQNSTPFTAGVTLLLCKELHPQDTTPSFSVGVQHNCAIWHGGAVYCWGDGTYGQLLPPTTSAAALDVIVGRTNSCALYDDNTAQCWGDNTNDISNHPSIE